MRLVLISDTHLRHQRSIIEIPEGDVLIHAGDACLKGDFFEVRDFFDWFSSQKARHKIFVAGNHDWLFEKDPELARSMVPKNVIYLEDSIVTIDGLKIYGSPWQPEFNEWAFNLPRGWPLRKRWEEIPSGIDVLVTHGPPLGILDWSKFGREHVGCEDLRQELYRIKPRLHVFGHIHGDYGQAKIGRILFVNASICDEAYRPMRDPVIVELPTTGDAMLIPWTSGPKKAVPTSPAEPLW